jgi:hypothetical protein
MSDPVSELKRELHAAAERQFRAEAHVQARERRGRSRVYLAVAMVAASAAVLGLLVAPWDQTGRFLEKAQAALTPPEGSILHQKWETTTTSADPACTVARVPTEVWIHQEAPYKYRTILNLVGPDYLPVPPDPPLDPRKLACERGRRAELGGTLECPNHGCPTLRFEPPNQLVMNGAAQFGFDPEPVNGLLDAISDGRAHQEGKTEIEGRTVERIRLDPPKCPTLGCDGEPGYAYVDPETFYPVRIEAPGLIRTPGQPLVRLQVVVDYLTFEYLPRTPTNLALTDIQAQHPNATEEP